MRGASMHGVQFKQIDPNDPDMVQINYGLYTRRAMRALNHIFCTDDVSEGLMRYANACPCQVLVDLPFEGSALYWHCLVGRQWDGQLYSQTARFHGLWLTEFAKLRPKLQAVEEWFETMLKQYLKDEWRQLQPAKDAVKIAKWLLYGEELPAILKGEPMNPFETAAVDAISREYAALLKAHKLADDSRRALKAAWDAYAKRLRVKA